MQYKNFVNLQCSDIVAVLFRTIELFASRYFWKFASASYPVTATFFSFW